MFVSSFVPEAAELSRKVQLWRNSEKWKITMQHLHSAIKNPRPSISTDSLFVSQHLVALLRSPAPPCFLSSACERFRFRASSTLHDGQGQHNISNNCDMERYIYNNYLLDRAEGCPLVGRLVLGRLLV